MGHWRRLVRDVELMADDLLERLRKTLHPIVSGSLAPLAQRLEEECARDSEIRWSSPLVSCLLQSVPQ